MYWQTYPPCPTQRLACCSHYSTPCFSLLINTSWSQLHTDTYSNNLSKYMSKQPHSPNCVLSVVIFMLKAQVSTWDRPCHLESLKYLLLPTIRKSLLTPITLININVFICSLLVNIQVKMDILGEERKARNQLGRSWYKEARPREGTSEYATTFQSITSFF